MKFKSLFYLFSILISCILASLYTENIDQSIGIILLGYSILGSFIFNKNSVFFEPINLFNLFLISTLIAFIYYYNIGFYHSKYITQTTFSFDINSVFTKSIYYTWIGYLSILVGYFSIKKRFNYEIKIDQNISNLALKWTIFIFLSLAFLNFSYNIILYADGNILSYLKNVSIREYEFKSGGTTLGYTFGFSAIYLWQYLNYKSKKKSKLFFICLILLIIMKFSLGRLFQTIAFLISVLIVQYFLYYKDNIQKNLKYFFQFGFFIIFGVFLFFLRTLSSLYFNNMVSTQFSDQLSSFISPENLSENIIEAGNLPNIPVFMKIIDSWEKDIGFLYGKSFLSFIYNSLPSIIRPIGYQPSVMVKKQWYESLIGGSLPPTGFGEMYANFGLIGIVLGMIIFGLFMAYSFNLLKKINSIWYLIIYSQVAIGFFAIFPKGEIDNFSLFLIFPTLILYFIALIISHLIKPSAIKSINPNQ